MTFNISKLGLVRKNQLINANFKKIYHCTRSPSNGLLIVLCKLTFCFCTISGFIRLDATLRREKNLCEQPFAFLMTIKTNVKCNNVLLFCRSIRLNDHHQQQKQHQKKKQTKKIRSIGKTTTLLVHHTFFVHFLAVLHAVTTSWKRLISRFGRA